MKKHTLFDVSIVGGGPFACFTAYLLAKKGLNVALIYPENLNPMASFLTSLNACWPSLNDPPTRAYNAHGKELADYLNLFCHQGLQLFKKELFAGEWVSSKCLRIGTKDFEKQELAQACALGFELQETEKNGVYIEKNTSLICTDTLKFQEEFITKLIEQKIKMISSSAISIQESQNNCTINLENKNKVESEIVVLGAALNIAQLLPRYKKILIPMSDCLHEYEVLLPTKTNAPLHNFSFRAANGHLCGTFFQAGDDRGKTINLKISGPKFLLPGAGAGQDLTQIKLEDRIYQNIEKYHHDYVFDIVARQLNFYDRDALLKTLPFKLKKKSILVDCYPCDELPLLGEYGKFGRILGNTGWLATGFSAGAFAAKIMCDLILNEKSTDLHQRLHPRRMFKAALF